MAKLANSTRNCVTRNLEKSVRVSNEIFTVLLTEWDVFSKQNSHDDDGRIKKKNRLQNSRIFCERERRIIFERKVWSECKNGEAEW